MYSVDEKLVSQTLAGDRDAFGALVHKYQDMVNAYAFHKVRNESDSQDITQEVFLQAFRHLQKLRHPHRFPQLAVYNYVQRVQTLVGACREKTSA